MLKRRKIGNGPLGGAAGGGAVTLSAPTLTNSSALGASPLVLSLSDGDYAAGKYLQWEFAGSLTPPKNGDGSYTTTTQSGVTLIDGDSWARLDMALGYSTPSGAFAFHCRVLQDDESGAVTVTDQLGNTFNADASGWSTDYTDTIIVSAAVLNTVNGVNKYSLLTVSGSPALQFSSSAGNSYGSVRSTVEQASDYAQFEVTITSGATGDIIVGIEDGTANLTGNVIPGYTTSTGIAVEFNTGANIGLLWNSAGNSATLATGAGSTQVGDVFTIVWKKSTHQIEVYRTRSGTTTQMGTTQTVASLTHAYAFACINNTTSGGTMNFGGTAYAKTPGTGVASLWA